MFPTIKSSLCGWLPSFPCTYHFRVTPFQPALPTPERCFAQARVLAGHGPGAGSLLGVKSNGRILFSCFFRLASLFRSNQKGFRHTNASELVLFQATWRVSFWDMFWVLKVPLFRAEWEGSSEKETVSARNLGGFNKVSKPFPFKGTSQSGDRFSGKIKTKRQK